MQQPRLSPQTYAARVPAPVEQVLVIVLAAATSQFWFRVLP